jgi:processive 1,2-diacylglycerol beta-glucosyltransferase
MKKVLILTASFGEGHNTAARSIRDALELLDDEVVVEVLDLVASTYGKVHDFVRKLHLQVVQRTPRLWAELYKWVDAGASFDGPMGMKRLRNALADIVEQYQPDCIVSTYPLYGHVVRELYQDYAERPFRLITVVTDSISVNSLWYRAPSDSFCVANDLTAEVLAKGGVSREIIHPLGFPVSPEYANEPAEKLDPPGEGRELRILYVINCGKRKAGVLLDRLMEIPEARLTITVGKDPELKAELMERSEQYGDRVNILGWTNQMPELMRSHHLVISKAGGATVQETIAAECPMIVNQVIPGQEEGNATLIEALDVGAVADGSKEVVDAIQRAIAGDARLWRGWKRNLKNAARPDAALRIARLILEKEEGGMDELASRKSIVPLKLDSGRAESRTARRTNSEMLLCDFHIHSNYSDGKLTVPEIVDFYGKLGFDCICITDHLADPTRVMGKLIRLMNFTLNQNQIGEYFEVLERERKRAWRKYRMLVMTGIEFNKDGLTKKSSAHLLGVDLRQPIDPSLEISETIEQIHAQSGLAIASHPHIMKSEWGKNTLYLWQNQDTYAPLIDAWEIANRNNIFTPIGLKNLRFIANSDFHKPKHIYSWKTLLHCEKDPEAIKECIIQNKQVAITLYRKEHSESSQERAFRRDALSFELPAFPAAVAN